MIKNIQLNVQKQCEVKRQTFKTVLFRRIHDKSPGTVTGAMSRKKNVPHLHEEHNIFVVNPIPLFSVCFYVDEME